MTKPTKEDLGRDLAADLAKIGEYESSWRVPLRWEGRTQHAWPDYSRFLNHLPLVARAAIRRAVAAEAEAEKYRLLYEQARDTIRSLEGRGE